MAEALYRKYRPQTFEDVVGQTHIERTLKNAIDSDKVSHAYLFCGPRGTGKTTTARLLAKALLCEGGPTPSPDGTCEQCLAIADGTHPDVSELDAASRTGVENVREEIIGRVQYAPTRGRYKIYIIDEVHMLSTAAFNALLKTLEEPPSHVVFVLCTTDPQRVPETIHSRCQRFDFHRLSNDEIVSRLGAVCVEEGVEFEGDALDLVAHRAQGGMRDALTALEQLIAFGGGKVTVEVAQSVLGSIDTDDMSTVVRAIAERDAAACFTWLSDYVETGADLARFARDLAAYVRDLYVLVLTDGSIALDAPQAARPAMAKEADLFGVDRLSYVLGVLGDLSAELRASVNPRLSFEIALTRMVRPESDLTLESLAARVATLEAALASGAVVRADASGGTRDCMSAAPASSVVGSTSPQTPTQNVVPAEKKIAASRAGEPAVVPPLSSGYRPASPAAPQGSSADRPSVASMNKAEAFRAELERRRFPGPAASSQSSSDAVAPASSPQPSGDAPVSQAFDGDLPDHVRSKIGDPSALQRGWQAALADLKRRRAAYGALMLSARVVAMQDGNGLVIEFSRENSFAFSAAQKPDIKAAISSALEGAFGVAVPFEITQGEGASSPVKAAMARASVRSAAPAFAPAQVTAASVAPAASTPASFAHDSYSPDDVVPYDDADAVPYSDADVESYAPWDAVPAAFENEADPAAGIPSKGVSGGYASALSGGSVAEANSTFGHAERGTSRQQDSASVRSAEDVTAFAQVSESDESAPASGNAQGSDPARSDQESNASFALSVEGPEPVDPYAIGKKLGFDSMPAPKKRSKGMIVPKGWPGVGGAKKQGVQSSKGADGASAVSDMQGEGPVQVESASSVQRPALELQRDISASSEGRIEDPVSAAALVPEASDAGDGVKAARSETGEGAFAPELLVQGDASAESRVSAPESDAVPARPNPFASRPMPMGIGGGAPSPTPQPATAGAPDDGETMDVADIFGAFGVSLSEVKEER
ncbi:MAG: DNA polymerase III subunit gamma/tau [Slackia sp.]|nr:DNA polymerase III subunit gamma/tau [Slackia sp.]